MESLQPPWPYCACARLILRTYITIQVPKSSSGIAPTTDEIMMVLVRALEPLISVVGAVVDEVVGSSLSLPVGLTVVKLVLEGAAIGDSVVDVALVVIVLSVSPG